MAPPPTANDLVTAARPVLGLLAALAIAAGCGDDGANGGGGSASASEATTGAAGAGGTTSPGGTTASGGAGGGTATGNGSSGDASGSGGGVTAGGGEGGASSGGGGEGGAPPLDAELVFVGDFEADGDFLPGSTYPQFSDNVDSCEHDETCDTDSLAIVTEPVRGGERAVRMLLRDGDVQDTSGTRVEIQTRGFYEHELDVDYFYGWSIFVPDEWVFDDAQKVVHQWHTGDGQPGGSPMIGLRIRDADWQITREFEEGANDELLLTPVERGMWTDWVMHIRWSPGDGGRLVVWKDGEVVLDEPGPNMHPDVTGGGHYQKLGMYGSFSGGIVDERVLFYDEVRVAIGPDGYALVAP